MPAIVNFKQNAESHSSADSAKLLRLRLFFAAAISKNNTCVSLKVTNAMLTT